MNLVPITASFPSGLPAASRSLQHQNPEQFGRPVESHRLRLAEGRAAVPISPLEGEMSSRETEGRTERGAVGPTFDVGIHERSRITFAPLSPRRHLPLK